MSEPKSEESEAERLFRIGINFLISDSYRPTPILGTTCLWRAYKQGHELAWPTLMGGLEKTDSLTVDRDAVNPMSNLIFQALKALVVVTDEKKVNYKAFAHKVLSEIEPLLKLEDPINNPYKYIQIMKQHPFMRHAMSARKWGWIDGKALCVRENYNHETNYLVTLGLLYQEADNDKKALEMFKAAQFIDPNSLEEYVLNQIARLEKVVDYQKPQYLETDFDPASKLVNFLQNNTYKRWRIEKYKDRLSSLFDQVHESVFLQEASDDYVSFQQLFLFFNLVIQLRLQVRMDYCYTEEPIAVELNNPKTQLSISLLQAAIKYLGNVKLGNTPTADFKEEVEQACAEEKEALEKDGSKLHTPIIEKHEGQWFFFRMPNTDLEKEYRLLTKESDNGETHEEGNESSCEY